MSIMREEMDLVETIGYSVTEGDATNSIQDYKICGRTKMSKSHVVLVEILKSEKPEDHKIKTFTIKLD